MRTAELNIAIELGLSTPRLGRYMIDSGGILDAALSLYERNARLAEAFYRPLQALEVCLRNHMNLQLTGMYGSNWHINAGPPFSPQTLAKIDVAIDELGRGRRAATNPAVVAELNFGFWVMLLSRGYDATLWRTTFSPAFSQGGKRMARQTVHNRMDRIRDFRNRVFHHEPIYHLGPEQMHADIIQAIAWLCPTSAVWAWEHSRVPYALENPWP